MIEQPNGDYPRELSAREREWCAYLLPESRPAYATIAHAITQLVVLGCGRWGDGDLTMGHDGQSIDLTAPMEPVAAYGEFEFDNAQSLSISIHHPDEERRIEIHLSGMSQAEYEQRTEAKRWCFSYWIPGEVSPASDTPVREVQLNSACTLVLALDSTKRLMWLHDAETRGNMLVPVTNFYNELMLLKGVRDREVALSHRRLFDVPHENSDTELALAFARYNLIWRKVDAVRLVDARGEVQPAKGFVARIARAIRGGATS